MPQHSHADSKVIWFDGKLIPYHDAQVPLLSHSLQYGCAVFEGIRAYKTAEGSTAIFRAEPHFQRFFDSLRPFGYRTRFQMEDVLEASRQVIKENGFNECYLRPVAYLDDSVRGLKLPPSPEVKIAIAAWEWGKYMGPEGQQKGVRIMTSTYRRNDTASSYALAKISGGYLTSVLARREATLNGFDEALLLDPEGFVAEGSGENLFMVKEGQLFTPPLGFILPGITRQSVMEIAKSLGYAVREERISRNQLYLADEAFFTGTAVEVTGIREVDHTPIGNGKVGPITSKIGEAFFKAARGQLPEFKSWLSYT